MKTPDWILEGFDSEEAYDESKGSSKTKKSKKEGKTFNLRRCPECNGDQVSVVLGGSEGKGSEGWECHKCKWQGNNVKEDELSEEEFMKYLDEKGEEVS